jgi:hypothetical protein
MCVIVENTLQARYLANRAKRGAPNLPNTFGDRICGRKDLIGLLIQELAVVAKCGPDMCQWKFLVFK